ncbi:MAG: OsmC family protein [Comamonadaceae bacterium]|nr:OsmC family protein [Comamonadaceae bacterium]
MNLVRWLKRVDIASPLTSKKVQGKRASMPLRHCSPRWARMLTNVNAIGEKMHLKVDSARMEFEASRRDEPPALTEIHYKLILQSPEPPEKLQELADLCFKWGTVTNTLVNGLTPQGELVIE